MRRVRFACSAAMVSVITNDGRNIVGILRGFDVTTNLILEDCHERVYSSKARSVALGLCAASRCA